MPTTSAIAAWIGGGGYATASSWTNAKALTQYTTTTQNYAGVYVTATYYVFGSQLSWDLAAAIPSNTIITSAKVTMYLNMTTSITAGTFGLYRDPWGPTWSTIDMPTASELGTYDVLATASIPTSATDGNYDFTFTAAGIAYLNTIVNTSTELEVTCTDTCYADDIDPSGRKTYAYIDGGVEDLYLTYEFLHQNPMMAGCNI